MTSNPSSGVLELLSKTAARYKILILAVTIILVGVASVGLIRLKGEVVLEELLPYEHPFLQIIMDFSETFGSGGSWVGLLIEDNDGNIFKPRTLEKIIKIDEEIAGLEETFRALTYSIGSRSAQAFQVTGTGEIGFESVMFPKAPNDQERIEHLKKLIYSDKTLRKIVASEGNAALIQTEFKPGVPYTRVVELLGGISKRYSDEFTSVNAVGFPVLMGWIYSYRTQIFVVFAISVILMILILYMIFRNVVGMVAPITMVVICTILGLGFIGWTGLNFSPLLYLLAFLVGARALSNAVQITHRYIEEFQACGNKNIAAQKTIQTMTVPNAAAVATDAVGFLVLILAKIVLMQHIAIMMTFWMATIVLEGVLVPIICSYLPLKQNHDIRDQTSDDGWLARINVALARYSIYSGRYIVGSIVFAVLITGIWQINNLKIGDPTPGTPLLWPDHSFNKTAKKVNEYFGVSSDDLVLYFKGDLPDAVYDPQVFKTFEAFDHHMRSALPDIYKSSDSFINIMSTINTMYRYGEVIYSRLPSKPEQLNVLIGFSKENVQIATKELYFDREMKMTQITIFFTDHTSDNLLRIRDAADDFFKTHPQNIGVGSFYLAGGRVGMEIAVNEEMKRSHFLIDGMVLATIFLMCSITFYSFVAGLMLIIPLVIANLVAFSYMSIMDIGLSINTLPVAAVGVGIGVDFAIYLYSRVIEEFPRQHNWDKTILTAVRTSGTAVVYTGLTLILAMIPWYFLTDLKFQAQMGFFLSMLLLINVILALTLHPLLIYIIKPRFIAHRLAESKR